MEFPGISELLSDNEIVSTGVLLIATVLIRAGFKYYLQAQTGMAADQRRRVLVGVRNGLFVLLALGLVMIWAPALRTFAISLTAFAVAIIIATKELILCISGSVLKTVSGSMRIGSWVEVAGVRGEVTDQNLLSTTLQELGTGTRAYEFTGRTVVLPNSVFLANPVKNERFFAHYVTHEFHMTINPRIDPEPVRRAMVEAIAEKMKPHVDAADRYEALVESRAGIDIPGTDPVAKFGTNNDGTVKITVSCLLPTKNALDIEQAAVAAGLAAARQALDAREATLATAQQAPKT